MSDFDKFFAEKFDGESQFPRREKNWNQLSKRLDAFDAGIDRQHFVSRTRLRYWQAAAATALLLTAAASWWAASLRHDNAALQQEVAGLTEKMRQSSENDSDPSRQADSASRQAADAYKPATAQKMEPAAPTQETFTAQNSRLTPPAGVEHRIVRKNRPVAHNDALQTVPAPVSDIPATQDSASVAVANTPPSASAALPASPGASRPDSARSLSPAPAASIPTLTIRPAGPDTVAIRLDAPGLIKPAPQPSRFRLGVQAVAGTAQPQQTGVSTIYGTGVTAEYNFLRNFWVGASAEWLQFDVSTDEYKPKVHSHHHHHDNNPPDPPHGGGGPGPNPSKLVKVESNQRQQHYSLGLRYALPFRFWVRPSVRVGHTWVNASPELVSFKFQKPWTPGPGGSNDPEYVVKKYDSQHLSNIWRFGVGLEKETPRWVFGLWADYSDNFGPGDATIDMLLFRAGVQYRFN